MTQKQMKAASLRNLPQYRDMSDDELEEVIEEINADVKQDQNQEKRIKRKIDELGADYDLSDLKSNDLLTLRALAQAYLNLEDYEIVMYDKRLEGVDKDNIFLLEKLNNMMSQLRRDISRMQEDLSITRKIRKGDKEESVLKLIDDLKTKAQKFYREKMAYIFCKKCNMLLGTAWVKSSNYKDSKITIYCERCNTPYTYSFKELYEKRGTNLEEIPETLR